MNLYDIHTERPVPANSLLPSRLSLLVDYLAVPA